MFLFVICYSVRGILGLGVCVFDLVAQSDCVLIVVIAKPFDFVLHGFGHFWSLRLWSLVFDCFVCYCQNVRLRHLLAYVKIVYLVFMRRPNPSFLSRIKL